APKLNPAIRIALLAACFAGIFAANYRTSLIALAPLAFGFFVFGIARGVGPGRRVVVSLIGLLAMAGGAVAANMAMADRMSDLNTVASETDDLIRPPAEFTEAERKLLSGRLYVWNQYLDEYGHGSDKQLLLGFGPDAWIERFGLYAHNTIVSYLYEFGLVGAALIVLVWLAMIWRTFRVRDWALRGQLICAHVAFVLLNMATMPFWQIEGLIFYGLLCGYTVYLSAAPASRKQTLVQSFLRPARAPSQVTAPAPANIRTQS
ncbi:MAG TPA: O-antigen ligase family protein, partial [Hyphomonadaceae bacterium]|nr:O-antigen ligase family protein [Hyphomonadaceae bacterium]